MRTAVIDIGSNTLLLLVVEPTVDGLHPVVDLCRFGRLGKGLDATGNLHAESIAASLEICREYRKVMTELGVAQIAIVGTAALREAKNSAAFVGPAEAILGAPIEIIAGRREADLAFGAVRHTFPELAGTSYVVVDVGGGSTEFVVTDGTQVVNAISIPIGAVRLTERHLRTDPPTREEIDALEADIDRAIAPVGLPQGITVIGTAGTATTMAAVKLGLAQYDPHAVTGLRLSPEVIDAQLASLYAATVADRKEMAGIVAQRADVIAAGVAIYARVVHEVGAPVMITCDRGIRWGVAYERALPRQE